jgi:hypothetical protein
MSGEGLERLPRDRSFWMNERCFFCRVGLPHTGQRPDSQLVTLQHTHTKTGEQALEQAVGGG